jgi:hypothetical protein
MGHTRTYAERIDLAAMPPHSEVESLGYCLANPGLPVPGAGCRVRTRHPALGTRHLIGGGAHREFRAPFAGDAVLYVRFGNG